MRWLLSNEAKPPNTYITHLFTREIPGYLNPVEPPPLSEGLSVITTREHAFPNGVPTNKSTAISTATSSGIHFSSSALQRFIFFHIYPPLLIFFIFLQNKDGETLHEIDRAALSHHT